MIDPGNPKQVGTIIACFAMWNVVATILLVRVYWKIWTQWLRARRIASAPLAQSPELPKRM